jgi:rubrerythrin
LKRIVIREEKEERQVIENSLTETEEKQPVPPILDVKKEKSKVINYFCKFCGIKLNKKATFCPQCGTRVKKK